MKKKILLTFSLALFLTTLTGIAAHAYQIPDIFRPSNLPFGGDNYREGFVQGSTATIRILQIIASSLLYFAAPLAVIIITMAAFDMIKGGAESEELEQAKKNLTWTVIGLLVIILSYSIVRFVITLVMESANVQPRPQEEETGFIPSNEYQFGELIVKL